MSAKIRAIQGKGDWTETPPTGMNDGDIYQLGNDFVIQGGVLRPETGAALVSESSIPGMSVQVAAGIIYVENTAWVEGSFAPRYYQVVRDSAETGIAISSNPSGQTRYDAIVQEIDKVTTPNDDASNVCPITVVEGTPGSTTITIPDNSELLAVIEVADGETVITDSEIVDYRKKIFGTPNFTSPEIQVYEDDTTITFDLEWGKYNKFWVAIEGDRTLAFDNVPVGQPFIIYIEQADGGGHTPTLPAGIITSGGEAIEFATDDGAVDVLGLVLLPNGDYQVTVIDSDLQTP